MTIALNRVFIFDYGALIALIKVDTEVKKVLIYTKLTDSELIRSMEVVARLIRRYRGQKTFKFERFIGIFGENYIVIGKLKEPRLAAPGFGFLLKLLQKIDSLGPAPIDMVIKNAIKVFPQDYEIEHIEPKRELEERPIAQKIQLKFSS